ncbi:MAG: TetR/AcrR family transcriptional regulator [Deltaproteobacteria bacterium]|nr:TetR/AcrR family transcriptional regulator [Deltaproteobacteria bacterium]
MGRKKGQDPELTRVAILRAAESVFADKGFAAAATSDIAKLAGVTKSLIHHHFGSKENLWQQVKLAHFQQFALDQSKSLTASGPAEEFLRSSFKAYFDFLRQNPTYVRIMWWSRAEHGTAFEPDELIRKLSDDLATLGVGRVRQLQEAGELRADLDARLLFVAFLGLVRHWFAAVRDHQLTRPGESEAQLADQYLETITTLFMTGALPRDRR